MTMVCPPQAVSSGSRMPPRASVGPLATAMPRRTPNGVDKRSRQAPLQAHTRPQAAADRHRATATWRRTDGPGHTDRATDVASG